MWSLLLLLSLSPLLSLLLCSHLSALRSAVWMLYWSLALLFSLRRSIRRPTKARKWPVSVMCLSSLSAPRRPCSNADGGTSSVAAAWQTGSYWVRFNLFTFSWNTYCIIALDNHHVRSDYLTTCSSWWARHRGRTSIGVPGPCPWLATASRCGLICGYKVRFKDTLHQAFRPVLTVSWKCELINTCHFQHMLTSAVCDLQYWPLCWMSDVVWQKGYCAWSGWQLWGKV